MNRHFIVRMMGAAGLVSLATVVLALSPLLAGPNSGAGIRNKTPEIGVNRALKGDRLPVVGESSTHFPTSSSASGANQRHPARADQRQKIPVGCEAAFSPVSAPLLAGVYRRCMT